MTIYVCNAPPGLNAPRNAENADADANVSDDDDDDDDARNNADAAFLCTLSFRATNVLCG